MEVLSDSNVCKPVVSSIANLIKFLLTSYSSYKFSEIKKGRETGQDRSYQFHGLSFGIFGLRRHTDADSRPLGRGKLILELICGRN